jgi:TPR repeat protein
MSAARNAHETYAHLIAEGQLPKSITMMAEFNESGEYSHQLAKIYEEQNKLTDAISHYQSASKKGHIASQEALHRLAHYDKNSEAFYALALLRENSPDLATLVIRNYFEAAQLGHKQAFACLQLQADMSNQAAIVSLGELYLQGVPDIVEQNVEYAIELFYRAATRKACELLIDLADRKINVKETNFVLGMLFEERRAITEHTNDSYFESAAGRDEFYKLTIFTYYLEAAKAGHLQSLNKIRAMACSSGPARYWMGVFFQNGIPGILEPNHPAAIKLFYQQGGDRSFRALEYISNSNSYADEALYCMGLLTEEDRAEFDPLSNADTRRVEAYGFFERAAQIGHKLAIEKVNSKAPISLITLARNRHTFLFHKIPPISASNLQIINAERKQDQPHP